VRNFVSLLLSLSKDGVMEAQIIGDPGYPASSAAREATRWNNDLLGESAAFRQSRRKNFQPRE
jgi:hypothetical protein